MVAVFQSPLSAEDIKNKARELGADLVGIAEGKTVEHNPPPGFPTRPSDITEHDCGRIIVLAKRYMSGTTRIPRWDERHKYYNDELTLTALEEISLALVYWLEDNGYPAVIVPPTHVDPWTYQNNPDDHLRILLSMNHVAVEAGLGTLGLNLQLLTREFGPRVMLTAVMCSLECEVDRPIHEALCRGPECGRCLVACPGDVVGHWDRDWAACDRYRSPHGFAQLTEHLEKIFDEQSPEKKLELLRSETSFNLWQSILRGAGVVTGCRRCQDVCPVGEDHDRLLGDVLEDIPESSPEKTQRLDTMRQLERANPSPATYVAQKRWIGARSSRTDHE